MISSSQPAPDISGGGARGGGPLLIVSGEAETLPSIVGIKRAVDPERYPKGIKHVLFTDQAAITSSNPLDLEWVSGKRDAVRLVD